jgi:hypothetical protein
MSSKDDEVVVLTETEADARLAWRQDGDGRVVHTFIAGPVLMGADMSEHRILEEIRAGRAELAGPMMTAMRHGVVIIRDGKQPLFCESLPDNGK